MQSHPLFVVLFLFTFALTASAQDNSIRPSIYENLYEKMSQETYNNWWHPHNNMQKPYIISINTQIEFDEVENKIRFALREGYKEIKVLFGQGPFSFKNEHISLKSLSFPDVMIHLVGKNTVIIPKGKYYRKGDLYEGGFSVKNVYLDNKKKDLNIWGQMYHSDRMVEVLDEKEKICRIHCPSLDLSNESITDETYLQLTEWYLSGIYKVIKAEDKFVYFIADDLAPGLSHYGNYNVNYDYTIVKVFPRFRVCNFNDSTSDINLHKGLKVERGFYECQAHTFFNLFWSVFNNITIEGIKYYGNNGGGMLISLLGSKTKHGIIISNCAFRNIKSVPIYMMQTNNVLVKDCRFEDCYSDAVLAIDQVKNTIITDNYFYNIGKGLRSCFAIRCQSSNFYVARNTIVDFGLGGIGVGKGDSEGYEPGSGIVEDNLLYYTDSHHDWSASNGLIDGGAIYLWTRNEGTTVRFNRIHNYTGAHSNRGIYCDDGAFNFSIYGNVITGELNSNYIDSRLHPQKDFPNNTNNVVMYNIVEGRYKYEGKNTADNGCVKGQNIVLSRADDAPYNIVLNNFDNPEEDVYLEYYDNKDLKIVVPRATRKQLRKLPFYSRIKKYIKV